MHAISNARFQVGIPLECAAVFISSQTISNTAFTTMLSAKFGSTSLTAFSLSSFRTSEAQDD